VGPCVTAPRIVAKGATYAVTRRCVCRKAFLGWWHPEVDDIFFWCLAVVADKCGVHLHHAVRVGSHYHLSFTITRENLGAFLQRLHHQMSCMLNTLLARERYDAPRELFDARGSHVMRLMDAEAQLAHTVYERLNVVVAGLADTCDGVPGRTVDPGLWKGAGVRLARPRVYTASEDETRVLRVSPPPLLYRAFGGDVEGLVHHVGKLEREGERAIRAARKRPAKTPNEVRAIHPWDEPMTLRESGGGRVPSFKTGLVGLEGKDARIRGALEVRAFRQAHASANEAWCAGDRETVYPHGTYEMRRFHGARVAAPAPDAWVSAPGPTLDEVKAELDGGDVEVEEDLVERVREAVVEGVEELVGDDSEPAEAPTAELDEDDLAKERPAAETHHRFAKLRPREPGEGPRRIIRLRDKRRGRGTGPPED
jgi:putative transposase